MSVVKCLHKPGEFNTTIEINRELARLREAIKHNEMTRVNLVAQCDPAKVEACINVQRKIIAEANLKIEEAERKRAEAPERIADLDRHVRLYRRQIEELQAKPKIEQSKKALQAMAAELRAAGVDVEALLKGANSGT